jgi:phosphoribosyl-ATP pyrophosphohydrolase
MSIDAGYLNHLYDVVLARKGGDPSVSYVAKLFSKGRLKMAQKLGEEAVETVIAAVAEDKKALIGESADLLFHWLVLLADAGVTPQDVLAEMQRREGISGLDEKRKRDK